MYAYTKYARTLQDANALRSNTGALSHIRGPKSILNLVIECVPVYLTRGGSMRVNASASEGAKRLYALVLGCTRVLYARIHPLRRIYERTWYNTSARLAQMVERMTLNHVVAGSIPAVGV